MDFDFDRVFSRFGTGSMKWDQLEKLYGTIDVLPMWVADMDFVSPPAIMETLHQQIEHGVFGYAILSDEFREEVRRWVEHRHGWKTEMDWYVFCPGVVTSLVLAIETFSEPGDKIIIQPPVYPPFKRSVELAQRELTNNPLKFVDGQYVIDFEDLEQKIDERTKLLVLCNPHNPVGRVWKQDELQKLGELCEKYDVRILSDEIHCDIIYPGSKFTPFASITETFAQNSLTFMAATKTFNIAGLPFSYTIIPNQELRRQFQKSLLKYALHMYNGLAVRATEAAYRDGESWLEQLLVYLKGNLDELITFVERRIPEIKVTHPQGTYLVWLDCRELGLDDQELAKFLAKEAKVGLNLGHTFGVGGEGFARINIGCPRSVLLEGLRRIEAAVNRLKER